MNKIPVFFAADENYAPYIAVSMASICSNTKSFVDFYILDGGISTFTKRQIEALSERFKNFSIEFVLIDKEKCFPDFKKGYWSLDMYSRLLIPELKPNLDKAIYLDCDTIVLGDISKLYSEKLDGAAVGAVVETCNPKAAYDKCAEDLNLSKHYAHLNSGILLIDCKKWRAENIIKHLFELEKKYRDKLAAPDQFLLNKYFDRKYKQLDLKYNVQNTAYDDIAEFYNITAEQIKASRTDVVVRHFCVGKPWTYEIQDTTAILNFSDFWYFASLTNFYDGMSKKFFDSKINLTMSNIPPPVVYKTKKIKLFGLIPLLTIKKKA